LSRLSGRSGSYTGLIGFNPRRLKALKREWAPTQRTYHCMRNLLQVDLLTKKVVSESRMTCANFSLPRRLCSWLRPDVCDKQTFDENAREAVNSNYTSTIHFWRQEFHSRLRWNGKTLTTYFRAAIMRLSARNYYKMSVHFRDVARKEFRIVRWRCWFQTISAKTAYWFATEIAYEYIRR